MFHHDYSVPAAHGSHSPRDATPERLAGSARDPHDRRGAGTTAMKMYICNDPRVVGEEVHG